MATHLVKIKLDDGDLRIMEIPTPPCFEGLMKAVAETFAVPSGQERALAFTYKDNDGDEVSGRAESLTPPPAESAISAVAPWVHVKLGRSLRKSLLLCR